MLLTDAVASARSAHNAASSLAIAETLCFGTLAVVLASYLSVLVPQYLLNHHVVHSETVECGSESTAETVEPVPLR